MYVQTSPSEKTQQGACCWCSAVGAHDEGLSAGLLRNCFLLHRFLLHLPRLETRSQKNFPRSIFLKPTNRVRGYGFRLHIGSFSRQSAFLAYVLVVCAVEELVANVFMRYMVRNKNLCGRSIYAACAWYHLDK